MPTTDTGDLGTLTFVSATVVDPESTGENYIKVTFTLDDTGATDTLDGFLIWHDDEAGSTTAVWVNACDAELAGGGDGSAPATYEVLVPVPLATTGAIWWEGFEEYANGTAVTMNGGGAMWSGAWLVSLNGAMVDDFESYSTGAVGTLNGGTGFSGAWVIGAND